MVQVKASTRWYKLLFYNATIFLKIIFLSLHLLPRMNVMFDIILWALTSCEKRESSENSKLKYMSPAVFEPAINLSHRLGKLHGA